MSNNACDAKRHKTKKFSFKRKPNDGNQTEHVASVKELQKQPEASKPKPSTNQSPVSKKPTPETKKPTPDTRKPTPETRKQVSETRHYPEDDDFCKNQNDQTEITQNDSVEMVIKTMK